MPKTQHTNKQPIKKENKCSLTDTLFIFAGKSNTTGVKNIKVARNKPAFMRLKYRVRRLHRKCR